MLSFYFVWILIIHTWKFLIRKMGGGNLIDSRLMERIESWSHPTLHVYNR